MYISTTSRCTFIHVHCRIITRPRRLPPLLSYNNLSLSSFSLVCFYPMDHSGTPDNDQLFHLPQDFLDQIRNMVNSSQSVISVLPKLSEKQVEHAGHSDSTCPVCLTPFSTLLAEEEMALAMDSPAHAVEDLGVTRLAEQWQCGHYFCRRDISRWIREGNRTCPICRKAMAKPDPSQPPPTSDPQISAAMDEWETLLHQMESHAALFARTQGTGASSQREDEQRDHEFSGMYS